MLIRDSREKLPEIVDSCDGHRLLEYRLGEDSPAYSYDFELTVTATGQILRAERKGLDDAVSSWTGDKLERQVAATDLFIVEIGPFDVIAPDSPEDRFMRHLRVLQLSMPVWITAGPTETVEWLRWLEKRKDGLTVRPNKVTSASIESARRGIIRAVMAGSGHSPDRETPAGSIGKQIEAAIDWSALEAALRLGSWKNAADWGSRVPSSAALSKMADRLLR